MSPEQGVLKRIKLGMFFVPSQWQLALEIFFGYQLWPTKLEVAKILNKFFLTLFFHSFWLMGISLDNSIHTPRMNKKSLWREHSQYFLLVPLNSAQLLKSHYPWPLAFLAGAYGNWSPTASGGYHVDQNTLEVCQPQAYFENSIRHCVQDLINYSKYIVFKQSFPSSNISVRCKIFKICADFYLRISYFC